MATRREFLISGMGAASAAWAQVSAAPVRLGLDSYSIRDLRWKAPQLLDYAASLKLDSVQISQSDFESLDEAYLRKVRAQAERLAIFLEPAFGCICPLSKGWNAARQGEPGKYLQLAIATAKALGSPTVRVFVGGAADRQSGAPMPRLMEAAVRVLRSVRSQAMDAGVKIAIENHSDLQAREMKTVIEEAGRDFTGCCLDSGNPVMVLEDPLLALDVLAPYALTTHVRDSVVYEHPRGVAVQWVAMGEGTVDMRTYAQRFRELCPKAPFQLEIITGRAAQVFPYLEPGFWKMFPDMPAADFARFVALAKKGRPFAGRMMVGGDTSQPAEYTAALRAQQRFDLERSLEYCKKTLEVGVAWRG